MAGTGTRPWRMSVVAALLAALAAACGDSNSSSGGTNPGSAAPAPAASTANNASPPDPNSAAGKACADITQVKQSIKDLQKAKDDKNLDAAKQAWGKLTTTLDDLGNKAQQANIPSGDALKSALDSIKNSGTPDTQAKLSAEVTALKLAQ